MNSEGDKPLIVMVDDEKEFLALVERWALPEFDFVGLTDGEELLEELEGLEPDLLVLDVRMPGLDGFELCRRVRADGRFRELPVLFLTGSRDDEDFLKNLQVGGSAFLSKPVGRRPLLAILREMTGAPVAVIDTPAGD
jgi:CheY-like chemotaxis protein